MGAYIAIFLNKVGGLCILGNFWMRTSKLLQPAPTYLEPLHVEKLFGRTQLLTVFPSSEPSAHGQVPTAINTQLHTCRTQGCQRTCPKPDFAGVCYVLTMRTAAQGDSRDNMTKGQTRCALVLFLANTQKGHRRPRTSFCRSYCSCFVFCMDGEPSSSARFCLLLLRKPLPCSQQRHCSHQLRLSLSSSCKRHHPPSQLCFFSLPEAL